MPLGFCSFVLSRNILLRNCMDRIYYSTEHVYNKMRKSVDALPIAPKPVVPSTEGE